MRRRGGLAESEKKVLEEENATMRAKLADRWDKSVQPSNIQSQHLMPGCRSERQGEMGEKWPCKTDLLSLLGSRQVLGRRRGGVLLARRLARRSMGRGARGEQAAAAGGG